MLEITAFLVGFDIVLAYCLWEPKDVSSFLMAINYEAPIEIRDNRNGSWYWVHTHVLRDQKLSPSEKVIYSTIASYSNTEQTAFPSIQLISKDSGISERHVYRCLQNLKKYRYLDIEQRGKQGKANLYTLVKTTPDMMSPLTYSHPTPDIKTVGGDDKSTVLTISNKQDLINNIPDAPTQGRSSCPLLTDKKLRERYPRGHLECIEYISSFKFINKGKQFNFLHKMLRAGLDFADIDRVIVDLEKKSYYKENGYDMATIASEAERKANARL